MKSEQFFVVFGVTDARLHTKCRLLLRFVPTKNFQFKHGKRFSHMLGNRVSNKAKNPSVLVPNFSTTSKFFSVLVPFSVLRH